MSNIFGGMTRDGLEETKDVLGGSFTFESGLYDGTIKLAYAGKAQNSNAQSVTIHVDIDGKEYRETIWITNRDGVNSYADKKDPSKRHPLPGFVTIDDICLLSGTGLGLSDQETEEKTVMLYDFDEQKEVPKNVHVITSILSLPITLGIVKAEEDKTKLVPGSNPPVYEPTGETKFTNSIDKVFHTESKKTTVELREGRPAAQFYNAWGAKNNGKTRDKTTKGAGKAGAPGQRPVNSGGSSGGKPANSLFNKGA